MATGTDAPAAVRIPIGAESLDADLTVPAGSTGLVVFAHGSGSSRHSPRNHFVARQLNASGLATLLADLLTADEEAIDRRTTHLRFDIGLIGGRVVELLDWLGTQPELADLPVGLFGASTGAAAALVAAAERPAIVAAVVSRGGRPDLAGAALPHVVAPTLLLVGGHDGPVIDLNHDAQRQMRCPVRLEVIAGATHLFEEPGTLEQVADRAATWFGRHLTEDGADASAE